MGEVVAQQPREACCSLYHQAVELVGKRWTGAIVSVLLEGPARFSEIRECVPDLSDRLLSERLKELEGAGIVDRIVIDGNPPPEGPGAGARRCVAAHVGSRMVGLTVQ